MLASVLLALILSSHIVLALRVSPMNIMDYTDGFHLKNTIILCDLDRAQTRELFRKSDSTIIPYSRIQLQALDLQLLRENSLIVCLFNAIVNVETLKSVSSASVHRPWLILGHDLSENETNVAVDIDMQIFFIDSSSGEVYENLNIKLMISGLPTFLGNVITKVHWHCMTT